MSECPMSAIPKGIWDTLDLFWLCHTRSPGMSGWTVQRTAYPEPGTPLEQNNWTMWAFGVLQAEFYALQADRQDDQRTANDLEQQHRKVQAESQGR